jgi:tetratricopeptide (TPR) repeat protein
MATEAVTVKMLEMKNIMKVKKKSRRWLFAAFIIIFITQAPPVEAGKTSVKTGNSLAGNYLAGGHAQNKRDLSAAVTFLGAALKRAPLSPDILHRIFALLIAEGRIEEAKEIAQKLIKLKPKTSLAHLTLAINEIKLGNYKLANNQLNKISSEGLIGIVSPLIQAWSLVGQKKISEALKILKRPPKQKTMQIMYSTHSALISEFLGRSEEAKKNYIKIQSSQNQLSLRTVQLLGALYERTGEKIKARKLYEDYLLDYPDSQLLDLHLERLKSGDGAIPNSITVADGAAEVLFGISSLLRLQGDQETPLMLGRLAIYLKPNFPIMQILLGDILESANSFEVALDIYQSIPVESSFSWSARLRVASILNRIKRTEEAIEHLINMGKDRPKEPGPLINLGDILRGHERFLEAVKAYDKALERIKSLKSRHWTLLYARGISLERSNQWQRAEVDLLSALKLRPEQPYVLNYLGYSWIDKGLNLDRAQTMIVKAASLRPNDGFVIDSLGWGYYKLGKYEKAVLELERAIELRPQDPVINDHLGDAYWQVGRKREAIFQWKRSLSLEPNEDLLISLNKKLLSGLGKIPTSKEKLLNDT